MALHTMIIYVWCRKNPHINIQFLFIRMSASYFPVALLLFHYFTYGTIMDSDIVGMIAGHIYYYLADILPKIAKIRHWKRTRFIVTPRLLYASPRLFPSRTLLFRDNQEEEEDDEPIPDELLREGENEQQEQEKTAGSEEEGEKNSIEGEDKMSGKGENSMEFGANSNELEAFRSELEAKLKRAAKMQEKLAEIGQEMDSNSGESSEERAEFLSKLQRSIRELREIDGEDAKSDETPDHARDETPSQRSPASNSTSSFNAAVASATTSSDELRERHAH